MILTSNNPVNHHFPEDTPEEWRCNHCGVNQIAVDERHFVKVFKTDQLESYEWECEFKWLPVLGRQQLQKHSGCNDAFLDGLEFLGFDSAAEEYAFRFPITLHGGTETYIVYLLVIECNKNRPVIIQTFNSSGRDILDDELSNYLHEQLENWDIIEESTDYVEKYFLDLLNYSMDTEHKPYFDS